MPNVTETHRRLAHGGLQCANDTDYEPTVVPDYPRAESGYSKRSTTRPTAMPMDRATFARLTAAHLALPNHECDGVVIVEYGESSFGLARNALYHDANVANHEAESAALRGIKVRMNGRPYSSEGTGELAALNADATHVEFGERHATDPGDGDASSTLRHAGFSVRGAA